LVDLLILQAYRSAQLVRKLYKEVDRICAARGIRYLIALPNAKSALLNARYLKLAPLLSMPIRAGISLMGPTSRLVHSGLLKAMGPATGRRRVVCLLPNNREWPALGCGVAVRTAQRSHPRLCCARDRKVAADLLGAKDRRHPLCRLVRLFTKPQAVVTVTDVPELVRAACRFWNKPLFVYAGANGRLPILPGVALPARLKRPILVQLRDTSTDAHDVRLDRFKLIDSDFA
jgi:hypothetical protein